MDVRITTDPEARMSVMNIDGTSIHVPEDEAEHLIAAGAIAPIWWRTTRLRPEKQNPG